MNRQTFIEAGVAAGVIVGPLAAAPAVAAELPAVDARALDAFRASVTTKHRQAFGAVTVQRGTVLRHTANSIAAYSSGAMDAGDPHLAAAIVLFGPAVALALDDAFWKSAIDNETFVGFHDVAHPIAGGNPYLNEPTAGPPGSGVRELIAARTAICVCNNALHGFSSSLAKKANVSPEEMYARARAAIVPGVILVPAGVAAVNALQESHYTYLQSTI